MSVLRKFIKPFTFLISVLVMTLGMAFPQTEEDNDVADLAIQDNIYAWSKAVTQKKFGAATKLMTEDFMVVTHKNEQLTRNDFVDALRQAKQATELRTDPTRITIKLDSATVEAVSDCLFLAQKLDIKSSRFRATFTLRKSNKRWLIARWQIIEALPE